MLDPKRVRSEPETVAQLLKKKGYTLDVGAFSALEEKRKTLQVDTESLQNERNTKSKNIGKAKAAGKDIAPLLAEVENLKSALHEKESELDAVASDLDAILQGVPNIPDERVPEGEDEGDNKEIRRWGEPRAFDFEAKDHVEIGEAGDGLDFATATKITGSRFAIMKGEVAKLHRALVQFMLDTHITEHGYTEVNVPNMVNADSALVPGSCPSLPKTCLRLRMSVAFT